LLQGNWQPTILADDRNIRRFRSKDDAGQQRFRPDSAAKRQEITPEIDALVRPALIEPYRKLESARNNLTNHLI
jgi:hypothetical protein